MAPRTKAEHGADRALREGGALESAQVHDRDGDTGQLGRVHLAADRPRQDERPAEDADAEEEGGHQPGRHGAQRAEEDGPHAEQRDAQGHVGRAIDVAAATAAAGIVGSP